MTPRPAPFTGLLIEMPDRADRIEFVRTVIHLTRDGEFEPITRVCPHGDFLLTNLSFDQIEDVRAAIAATRAQEQPPEPPAKELRPRNVPIPDDTKALIRERLAAGVPVAKVAHEVQRSYSTIYYLYAQVMKAGRG